LQSGMVDDFINRKHGRATVIYPHPKLEPILRATYGVILYQEQVMQIAQVLAGYTLGSADILRRAMGKKKPEEMAKQRQIFCQGAIERQVSADVADHIFDLMEKFAGYGFNKSHSASYALIAYQTAWLKAHYPAAFMAAVLTADMDRTDKILTMMDECQALKLSVSPPNINQSEYFFKVIDHRHILFGLGAIKGVGQAAIENITETRKQGGLFRDLFDFCHRVDLRKVNRRVLEALIKAGCFDEMKQHRATLIASIHHILQSAEQSLHNKMHGQQDLFSTQAIDIPSLSVEVPAWNDETRLQGEKETLGFYLSGHPFNQYVKELSPFMTCRIANIHPNLYKTVTTAGIITNMRFRQTKRGDRMALFTLDDGTNQIEVVCFAENVQKYRSRLNEDQLIIVEGEVNIDGFNNQARIISHELLSLEEARIKFAKYLKVTIVTIEKMNIDDFMQWLKQHQGGTCPIVLCYLHHQIKADITFNPQWVVKPTDALLVAMQKDFPIQNVERVY
jgi:DNA polymerase III subunit alpha